MDRMKILKEREEIAQVLDQCQDPFLLSGMKDILKTIGNNESRLRNLHGICYQLFGDQDLIKELDETLKEESSDQNEQTYIYEFFGDFWARKENYQIEISMPTKHKTPAAAKCDNSSARFEKHDGHIVLILYSGWEQGFDDNGKWFEHVAGTAMDTIHWEDWWRYKVSKIKPECKENLVGDACEDYVPCSTNWDELFGVESLPDNWVYSVESLAYSVLAYIKV